MLGGWEDGACRAREGGDLVEGKLLVGERKRVWMDGWVCGWVGNW